MISFELLKSYAHKKGYSLIKSKNGFVLTNNLTKKKHNYEIKNISDKVINQIFSDEAEGRRMIRDWLYV